MTTNSGRGPSRSWSCPTQPVRLWSERWVNCDVNSFLFFQLLFVFCFVFPQGETVNTAKQKPGYCEMSRLRDSISICCCCCCLSGRKQPLSVKQSTNFSSFFVFFLARRRFATPTVSCADAGQELHSHHFSSSSFLFFCSNWASQGDSGCRSTGLGGFGFSSFVLAARPSSFLPDGPADQLSYLPFIFVWFFFFFFFPSA